MKSGAISWDTVELETCAKLLEGPYRRAAPARMEHPFRFSVRLCSLHNGFTLSLSGVGHREEGFLRPVDFHAAFCGGSRRLPCDRSGQN